MFSVHSSVLHALWGHRVLPATDTFYIRIGRANNWSGNNCTQIQMFAEHDKRPLCLIVCQRNFTSQVQCNKNTVQVDSADHPYTVCMARSVCMARRRR